jgi:hypothetical protein
MAQLNVDSKHLGVNLLDVELARRHTIPSDLKSSSCLSKTSSSYRALMQRSETNPSNAVPTLKEESAVAPQGLDLGNLPNSLK